MRFPLFDSDTETIGSEVDRTVNGVKTPNTDRASRAARLPPSKFGVVVFAIPDSQYVNAGRFGGGKSTALCDFVVPVPFIGMSIQSRIYARLDVQASGDRVKFDVSLPKGIKAQSPSHKADFIAHVEAAAADWPMLKQAKASAIEVLTTADDVKAKGKKNSALDSVALKRSNAAE